MPKVFVFGTLKEGFPNFHVNKGVRFRSEFETKEAFPLYLVGDRYSPWLILTQGKGYPIKGQVFDVSDDELVLMDQLERIKETDGYRRVMIDVICSESNEILRVYVYGKPEEQLQGAQIKLELSGEYDLKHADLYSSRKSLPN